MKKIFILLLLILIIPSVSATIEDVIDDEVKEKINEIEIDSDTLSKVSWFYLLLLN